MRLLRVCGPLLLVAGIGAAQPSISTVVNAASGISPALPNGGIAQGAIFLVTGSGLGPSSLTVDPKPFQNTDLGGTAVSITVSSTTVKALMWYTSAGQVGALLPSNTPTGTGTVILTYNGQDSATAPITVVVNNPGIVTLTSNGQGVAVVTYADYSLVSGVPGTGAQGGGGPNTYGGAAKPGDTLILWATGLGPVSGNDASGAGLGANMGSLALTVVLGGQSVTPSYMGRSGCCIGEDQIVFTVPANVPTGCAVPLALQVGNVVSNYTVIPIASGGRSCTPASPALSSAAQTLTSAGTGPINYGQIGLRRQPVITSNTLQYQDAGAGFFGQIALDEKTKPTLLSYLDTQPLGTCLVFNSQNPSNPLPVTANTGLDAGPRITVTAPSGASQSMTEKQGGQATQYSATFAASFFSSVGTFSVVGPSGKDVGSFTVKTTVSQTPSWSSAEQFSIQNSGVTRANGVVINWNGSSSNYYVEIDGRASTDGSAAGPGVTFSCVVPSSAGTFTVPPSVLLAMPATVYGRIDFMPTLSPTPFGASGLSYGVLTMNYDTSLFVAFL